MPSFEDVFGSSGGYLKAMDIPAGKKITAEIESYEIKEFNRDDGSKERKIVLKFVGKDKLLVLNKTNTRTILNNFEIDDIDDMVGKTISLHKRKVDFQGNTVEAIRVVEQTPDLEEGDVPF